MPTIIARLTVVLFSLSTQIGVKARPQPSDFFILNHFRNIVHRYSETANTLLTPRAELPRVASAQAIEINTIFNSSTSKLPFTPTTIFDPFAPSGTGRSSPTTPETHLVTSTTPVTTLYNAGFTLCPLPHVGTGYPLPPAQNDTASRSYSNSSTSAAPSCSTYYSATVTPICHTTITPLGNSPITITDCEQIVTFSTDHGYTLFNNRTLVSQTTKYLAPWDSVVTGIPQGVVQAEVCQQDGSCVTYHELWSVKEVMVTLTSTRTLEFSAVVTGVTFCDSPLRADKHSPLIFFQPSAVLYADSKIIVAESATTTLRVCSLVAAVTIERSSVIVTATIDAPSVDSTARTTVYSTRTVTVFLLRWRQGNRA